MRPNPSRRPADNSVRPRTGVIHRDSENVTVADREAGTNDGKQKGWWGRRSLKAKAALIIVGLIILGAALGSSGDYYKTN